MTDKKSADIHLIELATATAAAFEEVYPDAAAEAGDGLSFDADSLITGFERPKDPTMGRYALAVFKYARLLKEKPQEIAGKIAEATQAKLAPDSAIKVAAAGGFVNAKIDTSVLARATLGQILDQQSNYGGSDIGGGKKFLIEYSSPNVAKPFGIAHLRTTIIGNSLRRMYKKLGYDVIGINYFGDWGTQFGKMIVAFRRWGNPAMLEKNAIENLHALYVRFHEEAEENESLNDEAREAFRLLEAGDPEVTQLWKDFSDRSIIEFKRVYALMGIDFDLWIGESDMNEAMDQVIQR
ncbi:MAG: arginine--tRNA ligase, partial [candidate division Zixibacteria bacterium]|nr:arginine--tRNA ligase [candidate division Zixibacteria bacterium]